MRWAFDRAGHGNLDGTAAVGLEGVCEQDASNVRRRSHQRAYPDGRLVVGAADEVAVYQPEASRVISPQPGCRLRVARIRAERSSPKDQRSTPYRSGRSLNSSGVTRRPRVRAACSSTEQLPRSRAVRMPLPYDTRCAARRTRNPRIRTASTPRASWAGSGATGPSATRSGLACG